MTQQNLPRFLEILQVQPADLSKLSFCGGKKVAKVKDWVEALRATQSTHTSATFYETLPELVRLKVDAETRFEMLDTVRPVVQNSIEGLTGEFLARPLNKSEDVQRSVIIAQAIQKSMIDGYNRCVVDIAKQKRFRPNSKDLLAKALHRACSGISHLFYRCHQLYIDPPVGFWLKLHALFQIADYFDLLANPVLDSALHTTRATNIQMAYTRVLLMATAKLNQLNPKDITLIYQALESWSQYARLHPSNYQDQDLFFLVNVSSDQPPIYRSRFEGDAGDRVLQLNLKTLVSMLAKFSPSEENPIADENNGVTLKLTAGFPTALIEHLVNCWSSVAQRQQERRNVQTLADVSIGLVNSHYCVAGQSFDEFALAGTESEIGDSIINAITPALDRFSTPGKSKSVASTYEVSVQNVSAGGYCLLWREELPPKLQSGELIAIKERSRHSWSLGVIRWIRQFKGSTQIGIQNLANHPKAFAAAQLYDMGGYSDYMRAFSIPASKNGRTPASVITASAPFKESDKVKLFDGENSFKARLNKTLFSTTTIRQFAFQPIEVNEQKPNVGRPRPSSREFDDDWD